jgi:hypothetical protein
VVATWLSAHERAGKRELGLGAEAAMDARWLECAGEGWEDGVKGGRGGRNTSIVVGAKLGSKTCMLMGFSY